MPNLPSASNTVSETASKPSAGAKLCCVLFACATSADAVPRVFGSASAMQAVHGYCEAIEYAALHIKATRQPILAVGVPIVTAGTVGRFNASGNTDTCVVSCAAGGSGSLKDTDGVLKVVQGGTIGTDQILLSLSLDGGRTFKPVRLGTASSYVIPSVGLTLSFAAGDLTADETVLTWHSTAPRWDQAGLAAARTALASQAKLFRSLVVIGDLTVEDDATDILTEVNGYATENTRYVYARAQLRDRLPYAALSKMQVRMTGAPTVTFAEIGGTGDTITRSAGSFITDGFEPGMAVTVAGSASNNFTRKKITAVSATVLTLDTQDLVAEVAAPDVTITGTVGLTFAEVGATGDTITRSSGSWLADGFRVGDLIVVAGTASNNFTAAAALTAVSATVLTLDTDDLTAEFAGAYETTITAGETKAQHVAALDAVFADVDAEPRLDLTHGRARVMSPVLGYRFRTPFMWAVSIREYQHDLHIATWQKDIGPLSGWDLEDEDGTIVEHDEYVDGGALAARFTCARTWANGPAGTFVAMSLTRGEDGTPRSFTHNMAVCNLAQTIAQKAAESIIGRNLVLDSNGHATAVALARIKQGVDAQLAKGLLSDVEGEGPRASKAEFLPSADDDLRGTDATLTYGMDLNLNGTIVHVTGTIRVNGG